MSFMEFLRRVLRDLVGEDLFTESVAAALEEQVRREYGGGPLYVAKVNREEIRESVLEEFDGSNRRELCAKYSISKSTFYRMLKGGK